MKSQEFSAVSLALQAPGQRGKSATRLERLSDRHRCPFYSKHLPAENLHICVTGLAGNSVKFMVSVMVAVASPFVEKRN